MKKITQTCLDKIISYSRLYQELDFRPARFGDEAKDMLSFFQAASGPGETPQEAADIIRGGDSDRGILEIVIAEKIRMNLKSLLDSSEKELDKSAVENFINRLEKKC
jgi:hypothetical protein